MTRRPGVGRLPRNRENWVATSSASPKGMAGFLAAVSGELSALAPEINATAADTNAFMSAPCDGQFRVPGVGDAVSGAVQWTNQVVDDDNFVATVRNAFVKADATTIPDATIDVALSSAGISQDGGQAVTVNEAVYNGAPLLSGWSDDPVCTATGHFFEAEEDLVMPESLRLLRWERCYSSRFPRDAAHGPGWSSWASTGLEVLDRGLQVRLSTPDGRRADFVVGPEGIPRRVAGMEAALVSVADGYQLRWNWTSRWPGTVWHFDSQGTLGAVVDPFGGTTTFEHRAGRLVAMAHQGGRRLELSWDGPRLTGLTSSDGRMVRYRYQGSYLVAVERADGGRRYEVDGQGRILEVHDADGVRLVANLYDAEGRVVEQTSPSGRRSTYRYLAPHTVTVTDVADGPATVFRHDAAGRLVELRIGDGRRETRTFNDAGNPIRVVGLDGGEILRRFDLEGNCVWRQGPAGDVEEWSYDRAGRVVRHRVAGGAEWQLTYDGDDAWPSLVEGPAGDVRRFTSRDGLPLSAQDADGVSYRAERDGDGSITAVIDGEGGRTTIGVHRSGAYEWVEDPCGQRWTFEVDDAGRVAGTVTPAGDRGAATWSAAGRMTSMAPPGRAVSAAEWDPAGQLAAITDPAGATSRLTTDVLGDITDVELAGGGRWHLDYDHAGGIERIADPGGGTWEVSARAGVEELRDPDGGVHRVETDASGAIRATVSATGQRCQIDSDVDGRRQQILAPSGALTEVERDQAGRVVRVAEGTAVTTWSYSPGGRVAAIATHTGGRWTWTYDRAGRVTATSGPRRSTHFERDQAGRVVAVIEASGRRRSLTYGDDGRPAEVTDAAGTTRLVWNPDGRLRRVVQPDGAIEEGAWDGAGRLMGTTDALGDTTSIERDVEGHVVAVEAADGARWAYRRDPMGRPQAVTDPLGRTTAMAWTGAGRLDRFEAGGTTRRFGWDPDGRLVSISAGDSGAGLLTIDHESPHRSLTAADGQGCSTAVAWDEWGRVTRSGPEDRPTALAWDDPSGSVSITPAGGATTRYHSDAEGLVERIEHPVAGTVSVCRDGEGRLLEVAAEGLTRTWERDGEGRAVTYTEVRGVEVSVTSLIWDGCGRVSAETRDGSTRRYGYDLAGQLIAMVGPGGSWAWTYDTVGRLSTESSPGGGRTFSYDAASQLVEIRHDDGRVTRFAYDALGRRVSETADDGTAVAYRWDELGRLRAVERTAPAGRRVTRLDVGPLGELHAVDDVAVDWWPTGVAGAAPAAIDGRDLVSVDGHPVAFTGPGGDVEWVAADWAGGVGHAPTPWGGQASAGPGPRLGWCGEIEAGGLVWLRNRVYDPATRAFLSRDSLSGELTRPGALTNPYQYAGNDPVNYRDPSGRRPVTASEADHQIAEWRQPQWGKIVSAVEVVGGVALCFTPLAPIGAGILIGEAGSIGSQAIFNHGHINWDNVAISGAAGGVGGGVGMAAGGSSIVANLATSAGRVSPMLASATPGIVSGATGGFSGGLTKMVLSGGPISPSGLATDTVFGGVTGGVFRAPESPGETAASAGGDGPSFLTSPNGETIVVPKGATGPTPVESGKGFQFTGGSGGNGLDTRVTGVRIMDPVTTGKYPYPNGYVSYMNEGGQTVHPHTGQTISNADPMAHWPWGPK